MKSKNKRTKTKEKSLLRIEILREISGGVKHIESLLQRLPELCAAAAIVEWERKKELSAEGHKYTDKTEICPIERR